MDPLERADRLHQEAEVVMQKIGLLDILCAYGRVEMKGSYDLDIMVYPDIDLMMTKITIEEMFEVGAKLAHNELVFEVVFAKSMFDSMPGGLYLKPRINYGNWGRPWKVDIWSVDEHILEQNKEEHRFFKQRMSPSLREQIISYKLSIMTDKHRTPMYSGYYILKAFLDKGFRDFDTIARYLIAKGVKLE
jgi:hypothetical protein